MSPNGSEARPLHPIAALTLGLLGAAAMMGAAVVGARSGVALRPQIAIGTVLLALPALLVLAARPAHLRSALGFGVRPGVVWLSAALGASLWVASVGLIEVQSLVVPPPPQYLELFRSIHRALAPANPMDALVSLVVIAVLPGLCEELLVRGVLLPSLVRPVGTAGAVIVSAVLFAALHADPYRSLFAFAIGLVFGYLRVRTGSLWPSVTAHVALNSLTFALAPLVDDPGEPYSPDALLGFAALATGVAVSAPLLRLLSRRPARSQG